MDENLSQIVKHGFKLKKKYKDGEAKNVKVFRNYYGSAELKSIADKLALFSECFAEFSEKCLEELRKVQNLTDHVYDLNEKIDRLIIRGKFKGKMESGRVFDFGEDEDEEDDRGW